MIKDLFTEKDGVSFCPLRMLFVVGVGAYIVFGLYDIVYGGSKFMEHAKDWGGGLADLLGFGGGAISAKNYTEAP